MWIIDHEEKTGKYLLTKTCLPTSVNITMYYVKQDEIINTKTTEVAVNGEGVLTKDKLIEVILNNKHLDTDSYNEYIFFKYNLKVKTDELFDYVNQTIPIPIDTDTSFKNLSDIQFKPSLSLFNDFNQIVILYKQRQPSHNKTKTIQLTDTKKKRKTRKSIN